LAQEIKRRHDPSHLSVVFSTYHSIDVISQAQSLHGLDDFDLIICDEAHRTTGATLGEEDESNFVKVHDGKFIRANKRLYMTATPRIYGDQAKATAEKDSVALCSMDDEALYGNDLFILTFSAAVKQGLLVDYKVIVLAVEEAHISRRLQNLLKDENNQLKVDDAAKIVGCWKALSKQGLTNDLVGDEQPMKRAVAFCQVIEIAKAGKTHKVSSKQIATMFKAVVDAYQEQEADEFVPPEPLTCEAEHVDGGMNAIQKEEKLAWLKAPAPDDTCRILSNVRCLSEGVDVPALDAVLFLTPRNSQVDVVQSVGRVMRNAPGKKRGYVILPVVLPAGVEPHEALNDNKTYAVVWQVLQALRSHDDRFDAMVNKLDLIGKDTSKMEVIAITDKIQKKQVKSGDGKNKNAGKGSFSIGELAPRPEKQQGDLQFQIGEIERAIYAKLVQKVGNRHHWEDWANDIAKIARTHIDRIAGILSNPLYSAEIAAFDAFSKALRDDLNDSITENEIIEMLAQHVITKPVFDALFEDYSFAQHNPMSLAMQSLLDLLQAHQLNKEADTLQPFYESVKLRAQGIDNSAGKQKIIVELYDKFFANAFPKLREKLGIVYTPVEVVDFIIRSVGHILKEEFGQSLGAKGVHIIDPFTGTGTFITRLLQSGLISADQLHAKYKAEIHANEIVLLAYYIAAINIEAVYHGIVGGEYQPFEGICLTDTFQMYEKQDLADEMLADNRGRRKKQKALDIRVIVGNPPYSSGQTSGNDNNANVEYKHLDQGIRESYAARSTAVLKNSLYDSYVRAIRWATDRIGNMGIIGFVTGSGYIEKPAMDGLRRCMADEFTSIHVLNLRGDIRKNMLSKGRAKEGQNIFGSDSMTGIAITLFVKNANAKQHGQIFYHDIGDDLSQCEKLEKLNALVSINGITAAQGWRPIVPDHHGDWINQRDDSFGKFIVLGDKRDKANNALFENYSGGIKTNRDAWCYNFSEEKLAGNIQRMVRFYNSEVKRYESASKARSSVKKLSAEDFVDKDSTKISWTREVYASVEKHRVREFDPNGIVPSMYRPFTKQWLYFNQHFNNCVYKIPSIFPSRASDNRVICVSGIGARSGFSAYITEIVPDLQVTDNGQCYPLYLYGNLSNDDRLDVDEVPQEELFAKSSQRGSLPSGRRDGISDSGLNYFQTAYPGEPVSKEDIFYYVYGLLHSPDYRERYAENLSKEIPRIPRVGNVSLFRAFSTAGRKLADLHVNYDAAEQYPLQIVGDTRQLSDGDYAVEKLRYGKRGKDKDLTTIHYNQKITLTGVPLEAYEYVVNGKPALDWVIERQCVKTDKDSGIVNDANDWAIETMKNPRYSLELIKRVITVSLETMRIVKALPALGELN